MSDEWGPWIEHDGRGLPENVRGRYCQLIHEMKPGCFAESEDIAGSRGGYSWDWRWWGRLDPDGDAPSRIVRYRIRKPRALEQLREIARNPERELEDA